VTDLAYLSVADAAELLRSKKLSPVEYTRALISRAEKYDGRLNAFLRLTPEIALEDARRAEDEILNGNWRGPFHGVPYALKDIVDYEGIATTAHSKILRDNIAKSDAAVTEKLRAAGGVFMGKLSTHEFACGGPSFDLPWPPARNPWNREHFCGGSSSGAGAATAAGFVPAAIGTDTGGSVRNPAGMCGVVGMKPTYGVVSRRGVFPLAFSLDHVGALTRTVRDNALLLDLIAGHDPSDPGSTHQPTGGYAARLEQDIRGIRIGVVRHFYTQDKQGDEEMVAAVEAAIEQLASLGCRVSEVRMAPLDVYAACYRNIMESEAYAIHEKWMQERPGDYGELARGRIMAGAFVRGADYVNATRARRQLVDAFATVMREINVVVTANSFDPACRIDDEKTLAHTFRRQARTPFSVTGSPAISVPAGFSKSGLPLAIQIAGAPFSEALLYRVAYAYEQSTAWGQKRPALE